jgi:hypothetical protein
MIQCPKPIKIDKLKKKIAKLKEQSEKRILKLKEQVKKKTKKKISQPSMKTLRDTAWRLFSKIVRIEEKYICYTCGKNLQNDTSNCHAGHYVPRGKVSKLRYERKNVHAQCVNCNKYMSGNLSVYAVKLEGQYGMGILQEFDTIRKEEDEIRKNKFHSKPLDRVTLLTMIESYKKQLLELEK